MIPPSYVPIEGTRNQWYLPDSDPTKAVVMDVSRLPDFPLTKGYFKDASILVLNKHRPAEEETTELARILNPVTAAISRLDHAVVSGIITGAYTKELEEAYEVSQSVLGSRADTTMRAIFYEMPAEEHEHWRREPTSLEENVRGVYSKNLVSHTYPHASVGLVFGAAPGLAAHIVPSFGKYRGVFYGAGTFVSDFLDEMDALEQQAQDPAVVSDLYLLPASTGPFMRFMAEVSQRFVQQLLRN